MSKYVLTIDAGTTSERAILFNKKGEILIFHKKRLSNFIPTPDGLNMILMKFGKPKNSP